MVENDDVEKKKNDDVESDNVESEDELDDKFAERNEEDDEDVAKDRVEHVMLRIMMSKVMMSKGRVACCKAGPCNVHRRPRRQDASTCTDDRVRNDEKTNDVATPDLSTCTDDRF